MKLLRTARWCVCVCVCARGVVRVVLFMRNHAAVLESVQALAAEPTNSKALFRRAQAHRHKDDLEDAWNDIAAAVRLAPKDKALRSEALAVQVRALLWARRPSL